MIKESAKMMKKLSLRKSYQKEIKPKQIDIAEYIGTTEKWMVSLKECNVSQAMKTSQVSFFNDETRDKYENCVQVIIGNRSVTFDLSQDTPVPIDDQGAFDQLLDPQYYVETGIELAVMQESISKIDNNESYYLRFGGVKHSLKLSLEPSSMGDLVFMKQRSLLPVAKRFHFDVDYRPFVGIYKEHCMLDLLEASALIIASRQGLVPKNIDSKALFAVFGNETFLSVLSQHLRLYGSIRESLKKKEFMELEDFD